ncbi:MAG: sigma 54-interacting transcriptional regulator [bacterium]
MNEQKDFQEILRGISQHALSQLNAENCLILMVNPRTRQTVKTLQKDTSERLHRSYRVLQNLLSGWIMGNYQPLLSSDIRKDARFDQSKFDELDVKSVLGIPIHVEGIKLGTVLLLNKSGDRVFDEEDLEYLKKLGDISAPYLRNAQKIQEYFESPLPDSSLLAKYTQVGIFGKSKKLIDTMKATEAAAHCDVRVLLEGPSGTGKELIARAIHNFSERRQASFIAIDCGAIAENLLESELFGHLRGAFTGASANRKGLIEEANGGTLFMDEIANLPMPMQAKLMRVLQEAEVRPVGSNKARKVDVRIIAASSTSLRELVESGNFREDLYYRLYVYPIMVPPLCDRGKDISYLADHFLKNFASKQNKSITGFHAEILDFFQQYPWPGNIRELENLVERLVTLAPKKAKIIDAGMLPSDLKTVLRSHRKSFLVNQMQKSLNDQLKDIEAKIIGDTLAACKGNQSQAARILGISETNIRYKIERLKLKSSSQD